MKTLVSLVTLIALFSLIHFVLFDKVILPTVLKGQSPLNEQSWKYMFLLFLVYYLLMTLVITFITLVNKKYGPGVLLPLLMGKYRQHR